jgi:hypothetical protein
MNLMEPAPLQIVGGVLVLAGLFVLREFASGALKKAGEEFWIWVRHRRSGGQAARSGLRDGTGTGGYEARRRSSEHIERGVDDDRPLCLLPVGRSAGDIEASGRPPVRDDAPPESGHKSA